RTPLEVGSAGNFNSSTMIVITMATTPSVNAFSRPGLIAFPRRLVAWRTRTRLGVVVYRCLAADPFDELVELDRLLSRRQRVFGRKSVLAGRLRWTSRCSREPGAA